MSWKRTLNFSYLTGREKELFSKKELVKKNSLKNKPYFFG